MESTATNRTRVSWWFVGAALLGLATAAIHLFAGTPEIMRPLLASGLQAGVKGVIDVMWHHISLMLVMAAVTCAAAGWHPGWRLPVAILVGGQFLIIAGLFIGLGLYWFGSPWPMPQWVLFGLMAGLMAVGAAAGRRPA